MARDENRFGLSDDPLDLDELGLNELEQRNDFLNNQIEGFSEAARGTGGVGANEFDRDAAEFADRQAQVEGELFGRLAEVHQDRSKEARIADESKDAERAPSAEAWVDNPQKYDWPGLDTKRR